MIPVSEIERTIESLCRTFPGRRAELRSLSERIRRAQGRELTDRSNPEGHLTVSGTVLHSLTGRVLLLHHRALGLWIPPGGHIEPTDDSLAAAALREVCEETGICREALNPVGMRGGMQTACDFDVFPVPADERKGEGAHYHYNLRYLFLYDGPERVEIAPAESLDYRWYPLDDPYVRQLYERVWPLMNQLVPAH